jgi:hypothetical protein
LAWRQANSSTNTMINCKPYPLIKRGLERRQRVI